jgi:hypothetical protein
VAFADDLTAPLDQPIDPALGPHQVLGTPKIEL